jgi:hypothetical protein
MDQSGGFERFNEIYGHDNRSIRPVPSRQSLRADHASVPRGLGLQIHFELSAAEGFIKAAKHGLLKKKLLKNSVVKICYSTGQILPYGTECPLREITRASRLSVQYSLSNSFFLLY